MGTEKNEKPTCFGGQKEKTDSVSWYEFPALLLLKALNSASTSGKCSSEAMMLNGVIQCPYTTPTPTLTPTPLSL
jgi:hypothetical protein